MPLCFLTLAAALCFSLLALPATAGGGAAEDPPMILAGCHYFGGWFHCGGQADCLSNHFHGYTPAGRPTDNWFPDYTGRTPLLGNLSRGLVTELSVAAEIKAADTALDFFDVLYYDFGESCGLAEGGDPNLRYCLDTTLAWMLNSSTVWTGAKRLHFFVTYSNDIDAQRRGVFVGDAAGDKKWESLQATWVNAMCHPRYLKIGNRPVFNILSPSIFIDECGGDVALATRRLSQLRGAATAAGLENPIIGTGTQAPSIPAGIPSWAKLPHPRGYLQWNGTKVNCPGGCTINVTSVSSVGECQALCNTTANCQAITVNQGAVTSCQLLSVTSPGIPDPAHDTYTKVPVEVPYDWRGTYATVPVCKPPAGSDDWTCPQYRDSWMPNSTANGGKVFPYSQLDRFQTQSRTNQSQDLVPYVPNLMAGFDPRPWEEHSPSFAFPTEAEWEAALHEVLRQTLSLENRFGFPDATSPHGFQPAFEIYAWNEYAEGGILAPTIGDQWMKIETVAKVLGRQKTDDEASSDGSRCTTALTGLCADESSSTSACGICAGRHQHELRAASCTRASVMAWCSGGGARSSGSSSNSSSSSSWGGVFMLNTSPLAAGPLDGCPLCADENANGITGSCSCPAGSELIQSIQTVSDCAFHAPGATQHPPLRPAALGICLPIGVKRSVSFGGAFQVDDSSHDGYTSFAAGAGCRSPNLLTGSCFCPRGFAALNISVFAPATVPSEAQTPLAHTTVALCLPTAPVAGLGGAFHSLDPVPGVHSPCATANPYTKNCSCPAPQPGMAAAAHSFRIVARIPGGSGICGSSLTFCGEALATAPPEQVEVCPGSRVDRTGAVDASEGIQRCISLLQKSGKDTLALPAGTYLLAHRLHINASTLTGRLTISTAGVSRDAAGCGMPNSPPCAVLRAAVELTDRYGLLNIESATVTLDHIVLDGNRGERLDTGPSISCGPPGTWAGHAAWGRQPAYNSGIHECSSCEFIGFASMNALCGTGCEFSGPDATFERALFISNGDHWGRNSASEAHKWSDGLTIGSGPRCIVKDCIFADNSDINFIVAHAHGGRVANNVVRMVNGGAFGGIMMDNFNNPAASNFSGFALTNNTIDCGGRCHYGIEIGPRPWYQNAPIFGPAAVTGNTVGGAGFAINVDGAGRSAATAITLSDNEYVGACTTFPCVSGEVRYNCTAADGPGLNIAPKSFVDRQGETTPMPTHYPITDCP